MPRIRIPLYTTCTTILFITRKARGVGGLQRLGEDLLRAFQTLPEARVLHVRPFVFFDVTFPLRACVAAMIAGVRGWRLHLLDTAISPLAQLYRLAGGTDATLTACGLDVLYPRWWYQWMLRASLPACKRIVCISQATADAVVSRGVAREKISVIPCGVWLDTEPNRERESEGTTLVTVGRLIQRKGVAWFLEYVFPKLLEESSSLRLTIVGSGPEEKLIKKIVQERGLEMHVHLEETADDVRRDAILDSADLFLMPNVPVTDDIEGFGIACIEASAHGVPVVAARLEGVRDAVVPGQTGLFFEPTNPESCIEAILALLRTPLAPERVRAVTVARFAWSSLIDRYRRDVFQH